MSRTASGERAFTLRVDGVSALVAAEGGIYVGFVATPPGEIDFSRSTRTCIMIIVLLGARATVQRLRRKSLIRTASRVSGPDVCAALAPLRRVQNVSHATRLARARFRKPAE